MEANSQASIDPHIQSGVQPPLLIFGCWEGCRLQSFRRSTHAERCRATALDLWLFGWRPTPKLPEIHTSKAVSSHRFGSLVVWMEANSQASIDPHIQSGVQPPLWIFGCLDGRQLPSFHRSTHPKRCPATALDICLLGRRPTPQPPSIHTSKPWSL